MNNPVIEQIKSRLPISEVIGSYIQLIPSGTQFKARCPFHNEKTASFSVSPDRGVYYCFGCGARGDIFNFVQEFEGIDFKGALNLLADRAGVVLTEYKKSNDYKIDDTDKIYTALESAKEKFQNELLRNPEAVKYLVDRGLTKETVENFGIGFAPDRWKYIFDIFGSSLGPNILDRAGLIKKTDKGYYDRFRSRIMFPLMDSSSRVVGFSGRIFGGSSPDAAKYLNSPETEVFDKTRILFGFDKAKQSIRQNNFAILVEGQMDLVMSHQAGFKNTVATSGTAVSEQIINDSRAHLNIISKLTPNLFIAFDGDKAGENAMARAVLVALSLGMNTKVVKLPEGLDPADFILKNGADAWKELLKKSKHYIAHALEKVLTESTSPFIAKNMLKEKVFPFLRRIKSEIEVQSYIQNIAQELGLSVNAVISDFEEYKRENQSTSIPEALDTQKTIEFKNDNVLIKKLFAFSDLYPEIVKDSFERLKNFDFEGFKINLERDTFGEYEREMAIVGQETSVLDDQEKEFYISELSKNIIKTEIDNKIQEYTLSMSRAKSQGDTEEEMKILSLLAKLNQYKHSDF